MNNPVNNRKQLQDLLDRGYKALTRQDLDTAGKCCQQILQIQSDLVPGHFLVGLVALASKNLAIAYSAFQSVVKLDKNNVAAWAHLASINMRESKVNLADHALNETLKLNMEDDWMVVPSRYSLDPDKWTKFKGPIHYMYMVYPYKKTNKIGNGLHPKKWKDDPERNIGWWTLERKYKNKRIDDIMTSLGNCWFVNKKHLIRLGGITGENNSTLVPEDEITLKYWLSGGRVVVNKDVWVAHWWQSSGKRGYDVRLPEFRKVAAKMVYYWMNDKWPMQKRKMEWLIEKFWPIPEWPKDWKDGKNKYEKINMNLYKEMEGV